MTSESIVVADTTPLIALAGIGRLDLLHRFVERVIIPPAVQSEIRAGGERPGAAEIDAATWIEVVRPDAELATSFGLLVDAGEAEAIAVATRIPDSLLLLDDRQARRLAEQLGLRRVGTLGLLRAFRRRGWTQSLRADIDAVRAIGIHLRQDLVDSVLRSEPD